MTYVRADGSSTWQAMSPYFALHDLMHYAVEGTLGYTRAFLGLLAAGKDLEDFDKGARDWLPLEASWAEIVAGQVQGVLAGSTAATEVIAAIAAASAGLGVAAPTVTADDVARILAVHGRLLAEWRAVPVGGTLELTWPPPDGRR